MQAKTGPLYIDIYTQATESNKSETNLELLLCTGRLVGMVQLHVAVNNPGDTL